MLRPHRRSWLLLTLMLFTACTAAPAPPPPTPKPAISLPDEIPAGGLVAIPLPKRGTPDADPVLTVNGVIVDRITRAPVPAAVYLLAGDAVREPRPDELLANHVTSFSLDLPAVFTGRLLVRAAGYQDWSVQLEHRVRTSRVLEGPVELERVVGEGV